MEHPNTQINEIVAPLTQMNQQHVPKGNGQVAIDNTLKESRQETILQGKDTNQQEIIPQISFVHTDPSTLTEERKPKKKGGRRKINIEYITDKNRRHITFSKRKGGIMKKAYELSTLTGTQVILLVASETGHVYTFATAKMQPLITKPEGKNLIQQCLNSTEEDDSQKEQQQGYQDPNQYPNYPYNTYVSKFPVQMSGTTMRQQYEQYPPEYQQQLEQQYQEYQLFMQQQQQQQGMVYPSNVNMMYQMNGQQQVNGHEMNGQTNGKK